MVGPGTWHLKDSTKWTVHPDLNHWFVFKKTFVNKLNPFTVFVGGPKKTKSELLARRVRAK